MPNNQEIAPPNNTVSAAGAKPSEASGSPCMICGSSSLSYCRKEAYHQSWEIRRCVACGHGFVSNRPTLELLGAIYATEESHHTLPEGEDRDVDAADSKSLARSIHQIYLKSGTRSPNDSPRSLDVGAGSGRFSRQLAKFGFKPTLIDLDPRAERAASRIPGVQFYRTSFEELTDPGPYDAIIMSQVLEHSLDPVDWLRRAALLLTPGGVLAVAVPNFGGIYRMLGARDPFLNPPVHLNFFTAGSLRMAFAGAGLNPVHLDSRSEISSCSGGGKRKWIGRIWNAFSWVLNPTRKGIILRGFATRPNSQ